jgi:hypothetical protein
MVVWKQPKACGDKPDVFGTEDWHESDWVLPSFHASETQSCSPKTSCYSVVPSSCGFLLLERKTGLPASWASYLLHPPRFLSCIIEGYRSLHGLLNHPYRKISSSRIKVASVESNMAKTLTADKKEFRGVRLETWKYISGVAKWKAGHFMS